MPPEDKTPRHTGSRRDGNKKSKRLAATTLAIAAAIVASGAGVSSAKEHQNRPELSSVKLEAETATPPSSWKLTFTSNFSGNKLNTKIWATCYPWGTPKACNNFGNTNEEEWYEAAQDRVSGGVLHLVAQREPTAGLNKKGQPKEYLCPSGMVTSVPGFNFKYGYIQINARIPFGTGLWPALWLAASNGQWPPEIDILEHWGTDPDGKAYLHSTDKSLKLGGPIHTPNLATGWHTFTLYWTKTRLTWYYDGHQVMTTTKGIPQQTMYLLANVAVYNAGKGGCSGALQIKSIKVWQPKS